VVTILAQIIRQKNHRSPLDIAGQNVHSKGVTPKGIRKLRDSIGYSKPKLAKEMDVAIRTITRWENGHVPIPKMAEMALELILIKAKRRGAR